MNPTKLFTARPNQEQDDGCGSNDGDKDDDDGDDNGD